MTASPDETDDQVKRYAVRIHPRANRELLNAMTFLTTGIGDEEQAARYSSRWYAGAQKAISGLAILPHRFAVEAAESQRMKQETRRITYRLNPDGTAYHFYYFIDEEGEDGARVLVYHVRHASQRSLTPTEARTIREDLNTL